MSTELLSQEDEAAILKLRNAIIDTFEDAKPAHIVCALEITIAHAFLYYQLTPLQEEGALKELLEHVKVYLAHARQNEKAWGKA